VVPTTVFNQPNALLLFFLGKIFFYINIFTKLEGLQSVATVGYGHEKQPREKVILGTEFWPFCA
jgi:hypothetical protein